jgi:hypothetical protein
MPFQNAFLKHALSFDHTLDNYANVGDAQAGAWDDCGLSYDSGLSAGFAESASNFDTKASGSST